MKKIKDGWHTICGYDMYVEDGKIIRGVEDSQTVYVYKSVKDGYTSACPVKVSTFRSGMARGTMIVR